MGAPPLERGLGLTGSGLASLRYSHISCTYRACAGCQQEHTAAVYITARVRAQRRAPSRAHTGLVFSLHSAHEQATCGQRPSAPRWHALGSAPRTASLNQWALALRLLWEVPPPHTGDPSATPCFSFAMALPARDATHGRRERRERRVARRMQGRCSCTGRPPRLEGGLAQRGPKGAHRKHRRTRTHRRAPAPGFRPLGHTLAQFMMVLHRYSLYASSSCFSRSPVASSRLSMTHLGHEGARVRVRVHAYMCACVGVQVCACVHVHRPLPGRHAAPTRSPQRLPRRCTHARVHARTCTPAAAPPAPGTCRCSTSTRGRRWSSTRTGCTRTGRPALRATPCSGSTPSSRPCRTWGDHIMGPHEGRT